MKVPTAAKSNSKPRATKRGYAEPRAVPNFIPHLYLDALLAVQPDRVTVVR